MQYKPDLRKSNSSDNVGIWSKIRYNFDLFYVRLFKSKGGATSANERITDIQNLVASFEQRTGRAAIDSTVVEIGFGARPERAFVMSAFFKKVIAIDLDAPLLSVADIPAIFKQNGFERGLKSLVRHIVFDWHSWRAFHRTLKRRLPGYDPSKAEFVIGNAGSATTWKSIDKTDLVVSYDVFEHIPLEDLRSLLAELKTHISSEGKLLTVPMVFTGICGGHEIEWYPHRVEKNASAGAWSHLLDESFQINTYLNRLTRRQYCDLFEEAGFEILQDRSLHERIGETHLTVEKRQALSSYDEYELFSNSVEFWLAPRALVDTAG